MLCSVCQKNAAVIFINKSNDTNEMEGLCYECAKQRGINPLDALAKQANLSDSDIENMSKQFEIMFNDLSENQDFNNENLDENANSLGSIFSGLFNGAKNEDNSEEPNSGSTKKVKTEAKPLQKKHKALDNFGTNLTQKAKNNQLDLVVGRDNELQRVIQILNRRTKNNPCLIGEPGVGKTAIAQGLALKIASGDVPSKLLNKEVYLLDMTAVIAGTQFLSLIHI